MVACVSEDVAKPEMSIRAATVLIPNSLRNKVKLAVYIWARTGTYLPLALDSNKKEPKGPRLAWSKVFRSLSGR